MSMRLARRLLPFLIAPLLLAAECSEESINKDLSEVFGIDTDSPAQIGLALMAAQAFGSEDEQKAAEMGTTLKDFRRADHEQKGDRLRDRGDQAGAAREYTEALKWVGEGPQQDRKRYYLEAELANSLRTTARTNADLLRVADHQAKAAAVAPRNAERGILLVLQGFTLHDAGKLAESCSALRKARAAGDQGIPLADLLRAKGFPCD